MMQADATPPALERSVGTALGDAHVAAALTEARVQVDSSFRGRAIVLFGAVFNPTDRPADVVVVVRGPTQPIRLSRKIQAAGVWLNSPPVTLQGAPSYYFTASTRALTSVADAGTRGRLGLGPEHLGIRTGDRPDKDRWRDALVRLKTRARLYGDRPEGVRFVDDGLFRADVALPAQAPTGRYNAQVWLFQDGRPVSIANLSLTVEKVGAERDVYDFAHRRPWSYGLICVLLAAAIGYGASRVFGRR